MNILPKTIPSLALLCMAVFLYGRSFNRKKFKETRIYLIKFFISLVIAILLDRIFDTFNTPNLSEAGKMLLQLVPTVAIGAIWFKEYKKINKGKYIPGEFTKSHLKKNEILKVAIVDGLWICPSCKDTNQEIYDVCGLCGQEVTKQ